VDCQQVGERLPWLLNGTLPADEAEAVRAHLATCGACREDLAEARRAAAVYGAHLPVAALVDLAWGAPVAGLDPGLVQRHLEACPTCAEEVELARESRRVEQEPARVLRAAAPPRRYDRYLALAASVAVAFATGFWSGQSRPDSSPPPADPPNAGLSARVSELEAEAGRLRETAAGLEGQLAGLRAPQLNLPVFELLQAGITRRSAGPAANEVVVPRGAAFVAFLLNAERLPEAPAAIEIKDAGGKPVWSGQGLRPNPLGGYTLAVPAALLPPGDYALTVRAGRGAPATYPVRVRQSDEL
jgi:anti-sigma factor RsiW